MLSKLVIKNIALIDSLEVELASGMNVMTGETGAGKSIIVDSMNLALGERADRELIRTGAKKAVVEAWFADVPQSVNDILLTQEIEPEDDLVLCRELSAAGKNICRVNGTLVTLTVLKQISDQLVDIHGQHEHQSLLHEKNHIAMLDSFDERIKQARNEVAKSYKEYMAIRKRLLSLFGDDGDRERRIDMLKFQIDEIQKANITEGEEQDLVLQKKRLNAAEKIMEALSSSYDLLYESEAANVLALLKDVSSRLKNISDVDERYEEMSTKVDEAYYALEEIATGIRDEMDECYFDADELEELEERLHIISSLAKKYGDPLITGEYLKTAEQEFADLIDSEALVEQLTQQKDSCKAELYKKSVALSNIRKEAAEVFQQRITEQLSDLGMSSAKFSVTFDDILDNDHCTYSKNGIDSIAFYISTNRGEPQKPLRKIASGGEVSRIMLALKNISADKDGIPTMIFDEIDTGISGRMAQVVAEKLKNISRGRQVVCVTHLPQIASIADRHFVISKHSDESTTTTSLKHIDGEPRVVEIARLAGGNSSVAAQHAKEMLERAADF